MAPTVVDPADYVIDRWTIGPRFLNCLPLTLIRLSRDLEDASTGSRLFAIVTTRLCVLTIVSQRKTSFSVVNGLNDTPVIR